MIAQEYRKRYGAVDGRAIFNLTHPLVRHGKAVMKVLALLSVQAFKDTIVGLMRAQQAWLNLALRTAFQSPIIHQRILAKCELELVRNLLLKYPRAQMP